MIQIVTTPNEINASIIRDFLKANGINASYAPNTSKSGHVASCTVYCLKEKAELALKLLRDSNLIKN